jgi:hypothetical protein
MPEVFADRGMMEKMTKPHIGQRVWADGMTGTFTVVRIYEYQGTADLELTTGTKKTELHIPFAAIHPDRRGASLVKG